MAGGTASAEVSEVPLESATNGVAIASNGNVWVAEQFSSQVARLSPTGQVLAQYNVGGEPLGVAAGPGGRIWVAVPGAKKLVWFDAAAAFPAPHDVSTTGASSCGPITVVDGGDSNIYFSAPSDGACNAGVSIIGRVAADGSGAATGKANLGEAFDLAAIGGKLYVPDFGGDLVHRVGESMFASEATITTPAGSGPEFIAASPTGEIWVSLSAGNQVAHFPVTQNSGPATIVPLAPGVVSSPAGIAFGSDGATYVASLENSALVRIVGAAATSIALPGDAVPLDLATAADGSVWITDQGRARILHYIPPAPPVVQPPTSPPTSPAPTPDKTPPVANLEGKKTQPAGESVTVVASCSSEACQALVTGKLELKPAKGGGKAKAYPLQKSRATIPAGGKKTLKLKLTAAAKKAVKPVLASGGKAIAKVDLRVTDAAGNATVKHLSVKLTSAAPR